MFYYQIKYWDEISNEETDESGILGAEDYSAAATKLVSDYGKDNVVKITLQELLSDVMCLEELREVFDFEKK